MKCWRILMMVAVCGGLLPVSQAQQQPAASSQQESPATAAAKSVAEAPAPTQTPEQSVEVLRRRANAFYIAIVKGDRSGAGQYVAPESQSDYEQLDLRALNAATVDNVTVSPEALTAVVEVTRSFAPPYSMAIPWKDNWKQIDGQWYLVLPKAAGESPFGNMKVPAAAPMTDEQMQQLMQRQIERQKQIIDPDQVARQLDKMMREQELAKQKAEAEKAAKTQPPAPDTSKSKSRKKGSKKASAAAQSAQSQPNPPQQH